MVFGSVLVPFWTAAHFGGSGGGVVVWSFWMGGAGERRPVYFQPESAAEPMELDAHESAPGREEYKRRGPAWLAFQSTCSSFSVFSGVLSCCSCDARALCIVTSSPSFINRPSTATQLSGDPPRVRILFFSLLLMFFVKTKKCCWCGRCCCCRWRQ